MATVYGVNETKKDAVPSQKIPAGEAKGELQIAYDEYVFAADVMAANDIIELALDIPQGARIVDACVMAPSTGTTGIFQLGTATDPDALVVTADAGGQAVKAMAAAGAADLGKKLTAATSYQIKCTEATDAADTLTIKAWISYVLV